MTAFVAAGLGAVSVLLCWPPQSWWVRWRLGLLDLRRPPTRVALVGPVLVTAAVLDSVHLILLALTAAGVGGAVVRQVRRARRRSLAARCRAETSEMIELLAAELRAGISPLQGVRSLAGEFPFLLPAVRASDLGGEVAVALRQEAHHEGRELLAQLAGAWQVADRSGAPLAEVLDRLASTVRDDREVEREVSGSVAPARATGQLMALLPLIGLALGTGLGADPWGLITGTTIGALLLLVGVLLAWLGAIWIDALADRVEASP